MGHVRSKTRSDLRKTSTGRIFSIFMKLGRNVCLDEISDNFENGSCQVKNLVKSEKNLGENVCIDNISHKLKIGSCRVKN